MKRRASAIVLMPAMVVILSIVLTACSGDDDGNGAGEAPVATATPEGQSEETSPPDEGLAGDPQAGRALWQSQCSMCHTTDGSSAIGPTWQGLWMSEVPIEGGQFVTADEAYIAESIANPSAKIHQGFSAVMPDFDLDATEIANVIAFIQTLED